MRGRFAALALLALTLPACGGARSDNSAAVVDDAASPSAKAQATVVAGTYVSPAIKMKTATGKAPAVVILPDTGNEVTAAAEATKLSKLGIGAVLVKGPASAPRKVAAFETAVTEVEVAVARLRKRAGVDPDRIGMIGEGVGAHVGAVVAGRKPGSILAAALADIGGVVVPSKTYAPERWLARAATTRILFQKDLGARAMNLEEIRRLLLAAPPATTMQQYKQLGAAAEAARDRWLEDQLVSG